QCHPQIEALRRTVDDLSGLMLAREEAGYVRHCHGDLHLKNIVLFDDEPVLFDAIEFDDKLTNIDVLYDLAFLLMDLWHRGLRREANTVFNRYFQRDVPIDEWGGLALLPMFIAVRAGVRAMVGIHGLSLAKDTKAHAETIESIHSYARLAADALSPSKPRLVAVGGFSGSGKTTLARAIVPEVGSIPGAVHIRSDVERKLYHGVDLLHHLPPAFYTVESREVVYQHIIERAEAVLNAGHSVILDAVFFCVDWRERVQQMAERAGVSFCGLWLEADPVQMMARVTLSSGDASDATPQVVAEQIQSASVPEEWHKIDTRGTVDATVKAATTILKQTA
ncbi:MAG: AAA family ATPase, partial [Alphaproteobacteria bacterium]